MISNPHFSSCVTVYVYNFFADRHYSSVSVGRFRFHMEICLANRLRLFVDVTSIIGIGWLCVNPEAEGIGWWTCADGRTDDGGARRRDGEEDAAATVDRGSRGPSTARAPSVPLSPVRRPTLLSQSSSVAPPVPSAHPPRVLPRIRAAFLITLPGAPGERRTDKCGPL